LLHYFGVIVLVVAALLPIVDPLGSVPIFIALTPGADADTRAWLARRVAINSFALLVGALIVGSLILHIFGLSVGVVQLAGGLVLCKLGWNLLSGSAEPPHPPQPMDPLIVTKAFYPLTLPVTVDPGSLAVALALGAHHSNSPETLAVSVAGGVTGVAVVAASVWFAYRYASPFSTWLGHARMMALLRLMAFITLCIGMQIAWTGAKALIAELPPFAPGAVRSP
jgi:multiple antibiotic resistance protein